MKKYLTTAIFVLLCIQSYANNYYGKKIGIENGLSQASVTCITYSNHGALWIGTRFGINEYSNGKIKSFTPGETGLGGCYINGLYCDKDDNLWVSSAKGLFLMDRYNSSFRQVNTDPTNCVLEYRDTLYIGGHKGLLYYDKSTDSIQGEGSLIWTDILQMYSYRDSLLCIDRRNGIELYKDGSHTGIEIDLLKGHTLMASYLDGDRLYLAILGEGVLIYDLRERKTLTRITGPRGELAITLSIAKINDRIWIGSDGEGIFIYDPKTGTTDRFEDVFSTNPGTDIPKAVTSIYQDPVGNIWIGGERFGLTGLKSSSIKSVLTGKVINFTYYSENQNTLYVGTNGEGVYAFTRNLTLKERLKGTEDMKITTIADFGDDSIIICAYNKGFFIYNLTGRSIRPFTIIDRKTNDRECLYGNSPEAYRLNDGNLLIFAVHNYLYDLKARTFTRMKDNIEEYAADLQAVYSRNSGELYTYSKDGIFHIDLDDLKIERVLAYNSDTGSINCIAYTDNSFVFGTDYGLFQFDTESHIYQHIKCDLFSRVTELCFGPNGILWIGADNHLFKFDKQVFEPIGENRGVEANELNNSATDNTGTVYLAGSSGVLSIDGTFDDIIKGKMDKTIQLHKVTVDGKAINVPKGTVRIPDKSENLSITVSLSQSDPLEKVVYKYIVESNPPYSFETLEESNQIPALKAGTYGLNVSYLKGDGEWSSPQRILKIKKLRPWYTSTPMLVLYAVLFLSAVILLILYLRIRMLKDLQANINSKDKSFISKFECYINEHMGDNELNVDRIAKDLAMSRATLYSKVKSSFAEGVGEYIERRRMEEARRLLKESKMSVAEIAEKVGYSTPRYFSARFKIITGTSPLAYRKGESA